MSDEINATFRCEACGADPTSLVLPDDPTDDDIARCAACGFEFGRYGDIKAEVMNAAKAHVEGAFRDAFKGTKRWKLD